MIAAQHKNKSVHKNVVQTKFLDVCDALPRFKLFSSPRPTRILTCRIPSFLRLFRLFETKYMLLLCSMYLSQWQPLFKRPAPRLWIIFACFCRIVLREQWNVKERVSTVCHMGIKEGFLHICIRFSKLSSANQCLQQSISKSPNSISGRGR